MSSQAKALQGEGCPAKVLALASQEYKKNPLAIEDRRELAMPSCLKIYHVEK